MHLGAAATQGMILVEPFYWDLDDLSRQWSRRFFAKHGKMPNFVQAGAYSAVTNYLKAVQIAKTDDAGAVMKQLKSTPINDMFARNGKVRADGRMVHDMYLVQVQGARRRQAEVGLLQRKGDHSGRRSLPAALDIEVQDGGALTLRHAFTASCSR